MAAYNEIVRIEEEVCPRCNSRIQRTVQFKYGATWHHLYAIGNKIEWGDNDIGEPGHKRVVVAGYPGECPVCGHLPDWTYDIALRDDVIDEIQRSDGAYTYRGEQTYVVVEP